MATVSIRMPDDMKEAARTPSYREIHDRQRADQRAD